MTRRIRARNLPTWILRFGLRHPGLLSDHRLTEFFTEMLKRDVEEDERVELTGAQGGDA